MKIIGLTGRARSGKDSVADLLIAKHTVVHDTLSVKYSFATELKEACASLFDLNIQMFYQGNRELIIPEYGLSIRQIMQRFGTDAMRGTFGDDFWVNKIERKILSDDKVDLLIIPDVRFENEAALVRKYGSLMHVIKDDVKDVGDEGHASESGVLFKEGDVLIDNNGTLEDLVKTVDKINL